jgi:putative MATE family efflux protein
VAVTVDPPAPKANPGENLAWVVWGLAWPVVALNSLQVVNALLDRAFIGHLDPSALTAHGASMSVIFLFFSLAAALGVATTALVSRAYGAGQRDEVRAASRQCVNLSLFCGIAVAVLGVASIGLFQRVLLPPGDAQAGALMWQYLSAYVIGLPAVFIIQALAGSLRACGDTKSPMVISGIDILIHIALNFVLIFPSRDVSYAFSTPVIGSVSGVIHIPGAGLGLQGAGIALALSAWIAAIGYLFWSGRTPIGPAWRLGLPVRSWVLRILRIASHAAGSALTRVGSFMLFTAILAQTPDARFAIAAMSVGIAIESIMFMPAFGLAMATSALVGQSLGAKNPQRAERVGWLAAHHAALVMLALSVPIFLGADWIAAIMVSPPGADPETLHRAALIREAAAEYIRLMCLTQVLVGYAMVLIGALQGAGDTARPMWLTLVSMLFIRAPLAFVMALPLGMGATGAWIAMALTQGLQGVMAMGAFKQGHWKEKKV